MAARCGNTGVVVGSEWCGLCRVHGCEAHKSYKQKCKNKKQGENMVIINDVNLDEELLCEIRIPRGIDRETIINPFRILGFDVRMIGGLSNGDNIYEVTSKPTVR
jgi:hypothetical protein